MPPKQCPACGRFLNNAFIDALDATGAVCPRCDGVLRSDMFDADRDGEAVADVPADVAADVAEDAPADGTPASVPVPAGGSGDEVSVRPPDLEPEAVRDRSLDVLSGWDVGVGDAEVASWQRDRRPVPVDTMVVVGATAAGLLAGLVFTPEHRLRGASLGAMTGLVGAAVVRRVWTLRA